MKKKTKNKADLTIRNAKAYNKRFAKLEGKTKALELDELRIRVRSLEVESSATKEQLKKIMKHLSGLLYL